MHKLKVILDNLCIVLMVLFVVASVVSLVWDIASDLMNY